MSKYDGPSFYKKNHEKIENLDKNKEQTPDRTESFENNYRQSRPDTVKTRKDIKEVALDYMETPSRGQNETRQESNKERFQSKQIPPSLQKLDGWSQTNKNQKTIMEIEERLEKEAGSYLLFADETKTTKTKRKQAVFKNKNINADVDPETKKKVERVQEKMSADLSKPSAGLHRSLTNIMDDDEKALKNGKDNLNSLFNEE